MIKTSAFIDFNYAVFSPLTVLTFTKGNFVVTDCFNALIKRRAEECVGSDAS
jgi:hypothetical protein